MIRTVRAAMMHLADKERRSHLSRRLFEQLPRFVAEERYLDGWIIRHCAHMTAEDSDQSNPCLFHMFCYGYDAWQEEKRAREAGMLREMGMDPDRLKSMSFEEIDAWIRERQSDPTITARIEAQFEARPELRAEAIANCQAIERDFAELLEHEEARQLLLTPEELMPMLPFLGQSLENARQAHPELFADPNQPPSDQAFADVLWPLLGDMARSIYTPERIARLLSDLRAYRRERFAGRHHLAGAREEPGR